MSHIDEGLRQYDSVIKDWKKMTDEEQEVSRKEFEVLMGRVLSKRDAEIAYSGARAMFRQHYKELLALSEARNTKKRKRPEGTKKIISAES